MMNGQRIGGSFASKVLRFSGTRVCQCWALSTSVADFGPSYITCESGFEKPPGDSQVVFFGLLGGDSGGHIWLLHVASGQNCTRPVVYWMGNLSSMLTAVLPRCANVVCLRRFSAQLRVFYAGGTD